MADLLESEGAVREFPHGSPSGYTTHKCRCSVCVEGKRDRDRSYYERNRDKVRAAASAYYAANRDAGKETRRAYSRANAEKLAAGARARYAADRERWKRKTAEWRKNNPEKARNLGRIDVARRRGVPYTAEAKAWIKSLVDPECFYCGKPATCIDHLIPVAKGGTGELGNLVTSCRSCNCQKWSLDAEDFIQRKVG